MVFLGQMVSCHRWVCFSSFPSYCSGNRALELISGGSRWVGKIQGFLRRKILKHVKTMKSGSPEKIAAKHLFWGNLANYPVIFEDSGVLKRSFSRIMRLIPGSKSLLLPPISRGRQIKPSSNLKECVWTDANFKHIHTWFMINAFNAIWTHLSTRYGIFLVRHTHTHALRHTPHWMFQIRDV